MTTSIPAVKRNILHLGPSKLDSCANERFTPSNSVNTRTCDTNAGQGPTTAPAVLVVEDDPDISMALHDLLEFEGFHVDCVQTCRQAFSSLEQNVYQAVLLDLGLPDGDGRSIVEQLEISNPTLPVIVLTASTRDLGRIPAYAKLNKPWNRGELCTLLHRAVGMGPSSTED